MENNLLQCLLSTDNETRKNAEIQMENERNSNPANLINMFVEGMKQEKTDIASLSCVLLKKYFLDDRRSESMSVEDLEGMRTTIMNTIDFNQPLMILKRKGDIISKIYSRQGRNEDLLKMLVEWASSESNTGRQFSMYVFEVLSDCHLTPEQLTTYKDSFMTIFVKSLTDREMQVRVSALKATTAFLTSIDDSDIVMSYMEIMPQLLNTVVEALKINEEQGKLALESMIDLANIHPEIWKNSTSLLINVISQIIVQKNFEDGTRTSATEIILALAAQMPASLRKAEETKTMLFPALMEMLTHVEEDMDTWATTTDDKEVGLNDPHNTAVNAINRLSMDLGEKTVMAATSSLISTCIKSDNWKQRQAGFIAMGLISECCKESMKKNMDEAMKVACTGIIDQHPRVRYAGLSCTALLLTELSPFAQKKFHSELMPVLLKAMNEETMMKLQCHAVSTVINFAKGLVDDEEETEDKKTTKIIELYSKDIFTTLIMLLNKSMQQNYEPLQEEVMNLISATASLIEGEFAKYYNEFMPLMMQILNNVGMQTMSQKVLRSRTIEAMGFMIEAVTEEKETFMTNVVQITTSLMTLLTTGLTNDDPQSLSIKDTMMKIAFFLKEDFHMFMPTLMTFIVTDAKVDIDIKMETPGIPKTNTNENVHGVTFKMKGFEGEQRISMNTSALESKISAFKLITMISESMGKAFAPYCQPILPIILENMDYQFSKQIRKFCFKTIQNMMAAVDETNNILLFKTVFPMIMGMMKKSIERQDLNELKLIIKSFFLMIRTLNETNTENKNYMDTTNFTTLGPILKEVLDLVKEAKAETLASMNTKKVGFELDEEDVEAVKEQLAKVCSASTYIMEISGQLVLNFKEQAATMVKENFLTFFALNLNGYKNLSESELLDATCFFCDFIEHAFHTDSNMMVELTSKFLEIFNWTKSMDVKQTLSYGMGVFSMFIPQATFATNLLPGVFTALTSMIGATDAFEEENIVATESALGAMGKVIYFQRDNTLINDTVAQQFLSKLPLENEEEEAQKSHMLFCEMVSKRNTNIFNENTKTFVMEAMMRIKTAVETNEDMTLMTEEGKTLLMKLLSQ